MDERRDIWSSIKAASGSVDIYAQNPSYEHSVPVLLRIKALYSIVNQGLVIKYDFRDFLACHDEICLIESHTAINFQWSYSRPGNLIGIAAGNRTTEVKDAFLFRRIFPSPAVYSVLF